MIRVPLEHLSAEGVGPRCLVTGASGYVGTQLIPYLTELGCTVIAADLTPPKPENRVTPLQLDITDRDRVLAEVRGVDTVFHCAARMCFAGLVPPRVREAMERVNVHGVRHIIEACETHGISRLVHISTANVCIDGPVNEGDESHPYGQNWVDLYGPTKAAGERLVLEAASPRLRTLALRPGGLWGPGTGGFMVQTFLAQLAAGRLVATIGDGTAFVDNTHVATLIHAMLNGAQKLSTHPDSVSGRPYFITDDERINGITWFRPIVEGLAMKWPTWTIPASIAYALAWLGELSHRMGLPEPELTRLGVIKLTCSTAFRVDAARAELDWEPLVTSAEGIAEHLDDYRQTFLELGGTLP